MLLYSIELMFGMYVNLLSMATIKFRIRSKANKQVSINVYISIGRTQCEFK